MVTYLYCVLTPPRTEAFPTGLTGLAGSPVRPVLLRESEGLEAWVATIDETTLRATGSQLVKLALLHNDVVEAALATGRTPLPARFGSRFANDQALHGDLRRRHEALLGRLHRVAGAIEMSVLVVPTNRSEVRSAAPPRPDAPAAGRRYLEAVRARTRTEQQRYADASRVADRVSEALSPLTQGEVRSVSSTVHSLAHLVWLADLERYRLALSELEVGGEFRVIVSGPRAPYSFVAEELDCTLDRHDSGRPSRDG